MLACLAQPLACSTARAASGRPRAARTSTNLKGVGESSNPLELLATPAHAIPHAGAAKCFNSNHVVLSSNENLTGMEIYGMGILCHSELNLDMLTQCTAILCMLGGWMSCTLPQN